MIIDKVSKIIVIKMMGVMLIINRNFKCVFSNL